MEFVRAPVLFLVLFGTVVDIATSAANLPCFTEAHGTLPAASILHFNQEETNCTDWSLCGTLPLIPVLYLRPAPPFSTG